MGWTIRSASAYFRLFPDERKVIIDLLSYLDKNFCKIWYKFIFYAKIWMDTQKIYQIKLYF